VRAAVQEEEVTPPPTMASTHAVDGAEQQQRHALHLHHPAASWIPCLS
jgi:hypothetical protein